MNEHDASEEQSSATENNEFLMHTLPGGMQETLVIEAGCTWTKSSFLWHKRPRRCKPTGAKVSVAWDGWGNANVDNCSARAEQLCGYPQRIMLSKWLTFKILRLIFHRGLKMLVSTLQRRARESGSFVSCGILALVSETPILVLPANHSSGKLFVI